MTEIRILDGKKKGQRTNQTTRRMNTQRTWLTEPSRDLQIFHVTVNLATRIRIA
jgi:hypothetical protein